MHIIHYSRKVFIWDRLGLLANPLDSKQDNNTPPTMAVASADATQILPITQL